MAKPKPFQNKLLKMYIANFEDIALFFYVQGIVDTLPSVTVKSAINAFMKKMDISDDDWPLQNAIDCYMKYKQKYLKEL